MPELRLDSRRADALLFAVFSLIACACSRKLERAECSKLLDRYTELLVKDEEPEAAPERIAQAQARARQAAQRDARFDFASCPSHVTRSEYECAMSAPTVDAVERCLVF